MQIVVTNDAILEAAMYSGEKGLMLDVHLGRNNCTKSVRVVEMNYIEKFLEVTDKKDLDEVKNVPIRMVGRIRPEGEVEFMAIGHYLQDKWLLTIPTVNTCFLKFKRLVKMMGGELDNITIWIE